MSAGGRWLTARAPAKLNLGLWIVRRRPDGYHDILTIFQAVDLCDVLEVRPRLRGFRLDCRAPGVPTGPGNLVLRAARRLAREAGTRTGAEFRLRKEIPAGAGLGGGSSDAAAALVLLDRLWGLGLGNRRLARLGLEIGSDVPFFLRGGTALGRGRGSRLVPLSLPRPFYFVLWHGSTPIPTGRAYSWYKRELTPLPPPPRIRALVSGAPLTGDTVKGLDNQLEPGLAAAHPDIGRRKDRLVALGAGTAGLTGSGSSVFGLFFSGLKASRTAGYLARSGYPVDLCKSVAHGVEVVD